jgi:hypothetical protein
MKRRNRWHIEAVDASDVDGNDARPSDLLFLGDEEPWLGVTTDNDGGYIAFARADVAAFLQRAARLREGLDPTTGERLPFDIHEALAMNDPALNYGMNLLLRRTFKGRT